MNSQVKKIIKDKKVIVRKPFCVHDHRSVLFKGCGPAISGYWG